MRTQSSTMFAASKRFPPLAALLLCIAWTQALPAELTPDDVRPPRAAAPAEANAAPEEAPTEPAPPPAPTVTEAASRDEELLRKAAEEDPVLAAILEDETVMTGSEERPSPIEAEAPLDNQGNVRIGGKLGLVLMSILFTFALLGVAAAFYFLHNRDMRRGKSRLSPYARAQAELEQAREHLEQGRERAFVEATSHALRQYLEDEFSLPAPERTTEEFLQEAADADMFNDARKRRMERFLNQCDMVKFASQHLDRDSMRQLHDTARELVGELRQVFLQRQAHAAQSSAAGGSEAA